MHKKNVRKAQEVLMARILKEMALPRQTASVRKQEHDLATAGCKKNLVVKNVA
jgi:hypothetical protein